MWTVLTDSRMDPSQAAAGSHGTCLHPYRAVTGHVSAPLQLMLDTAVVNSARDVSL